MAAKPTSKLRPVAELVEEEDDPFDFDDMDHPFFKKKFTVKDVLHMFKMCLQGTHDSDSSSDHVQDNGRLDMFLQLIREPDAQTAAKGAASTKPDRRRYSEILISQSDSATLQSLFAVSERVLEKKEVLVHPVMREAYRRLLDYKVLPNSTLRKLPDTFPPPKPTWHQDLQRKVIRRYYEVYGPDKPRANCPVLPKRERRPPSSSSPQPPEPEPNGITETQRKESAEKEGGEKQEGQKEEEEATQHP